MFRFFDGGVKESITMETREDQFSAVSFGFCDSLSWAPNFHLKLIRNFLST